MGGGGYYAKGAGKGGGGGGGATAAAPAGDRRVPGDDLPAALRRKLQALSYPDLGSAHLSGQAYCKIVLWLEEEKIRLLDKIDRVPLRNFNRGWYDAAADYAKELGVPTDGFCEKDLRAKLSVLNSLTNLAIHDIYRDKVEAAELSAAPLAKQTPEGPKQRLQGVIAPVNRLLASFSLPELADDADDTDTLAALRCIQARVCPPKEAPGVPLDLDELPIGLQVADAGVKRAAAVLRLLHGRELQELQVNVNQVINELQQLTADPKTDARLGRVGR